MLLNDTFTSTGHKFFSHQEAMKNLRNGKGQPVVTHLMATDVCQHTCAFCSVQKRAGDSLALADMMSYLDTLIRYGLKAVIISGGGNPILYRCKKSGRTFNDLVDEIHARGLEIGLITNGMQMRDYDAGSTIRESWGTVKPETLDKLTWVRISMAGLDHEEECVYVPDVDHSKTALGFSYVAHDIYNEPGDPHHGKVSTVPDLVSGNKRRAPDRTFEERAEGLRKDFTFYAKTYKPRYIRLLPNCLEPQLIRRRYEQLLKMANLVNDAVGSEVAFVQYKPPEAPKACYLGYIHPVLNCDGYVYPCDSCVLNVEAGHQFAESWRVCHWSEVEKMYTDPVRSLIGNPKKQCPGCVFTKSNEILGGVVDGSADISPPALVPEHVNFV